MRRFEKIGKPFSPIKHKNKSSRCFYGYIYYPHILRLQYKEAKRLLGKAYPSKESVVITANQVQSFVIF